MSFFDDVGVHGFWEKVGFTVLSPVIVPIAVVGAAYEGITGKEVFSRTEKSSIHNEQEIQARAERDAKEKRAGEERVAIFNYACKGLQTLQNLHSDSTLPVTAVRDFYDLKSAIHKTKPVEFVELWLPHLVENTASKASLHEITRLNEEISELKQLRQALLDLQTEDMSI